ncbi:putative membrane protein [Exiguobacterium sp. S17]|nr:putative membrane protein [Exiguobacterium sp. S17]
MTKKDNRYLSYASLASQISTALAGPIVIGYLVGQYGARREFWGTFGWNVSVFLGMFLGITALVLTLRSLMTGEDE